MKLGLIGKSLLHSFSPQYFRDTYLRPGDSYETKELSRLELKHFLEKTDWDGMNVTIPYKEEILKYVDSTSDLVDKVKAANTLRRTENGWHADNTDVVGFLKVLEAYNLSGAPALILGTGGASNSVAEALSIREIPWQKVSRHKNAGYITYRDIKESGFNDYQLIINATPLGTFPNVKDHPDIPYEQITKDQILIDLVYNPGITLFMQRGTAAGARVENGLAMLHAQADAAWKIWTKTDQ